MLSYLLKCFKSTEVVESVEEIMVSRQERYQFKLDADGNLVDETSYNIMLFSVEMQKAFAFVQLGRNEDAIALIDKMEKKLNKWSLRDENFEEV